MSGAGGPERWTVEAWEDGRTGKCPFASWYDDLDQYDQAVADAVIEHILEPLGMDICGTEWGKPLGEGLYELRIRRSLSAIRTWGQPDTQADTSLASGEERVLLRIFCTFHGSKVVLLFQGYDKGKDPSERRQQREIKKARTYLRAWRQDR